MNYIKTYEQHNDGLEQNNKVLTVYEYENRLGRLLMEKIPIFKSFKRALVKAGADIFGEDKLLRLFNNRPAFVYERHGNKLDNNQFKQLIATMKTHLPYFIQDWHDWIKVWTNKQIDRENKKSLLLNHNAIIYAVVETDEDELYPFAYVCELVDFTENEAERVVEAGIIDTVIDMTCFSGANNWYITSIVKFPSLNLRLK